MYEYYRIVWCWEMSAFYWMKMLRWCAVRMSVTPLETCLLWYVWFWVDSDGIRPLYQSSFVTFWLILTHTPYVFVVFMYLDVRDGIIMDNKSS